MVEALLRIFDDQADFTRLEQFDLQSVQSVYASPEQVFGIAVYPTADHLRHGWEFATDELASQVQSRLNGALQDLRWDMYLVLAVADGAVPDLLRKTIENDRLYFRKLVLAPDDAPLFDRLPFQRIEPGQEVALFQEAEFLEQLKRRLSPAAAARLGEAFFAHGTKDAAALFGLTRGGEPHEDSGD